MVVVEPDSYACVRAQRKAKDTISNYVINVDACSIDVCSNSLCLIRSASQKCCSVQSTTADCHYPHLERYVSDGRHHGGTQLHIDSCATLRGWEAGRMRTKKQTQVTNESLPPFDHAQSGELIFKCFLLLFSEVLRVFTLTSVSANMAEKGCTECSPSQES